MGQINIKVNDGLDRLFEYFADQKKIPKAVYVKELLMENVKEKLLSQLLLEYSAGKIGLKKILSLTEIHPDELLTKIKEEQIECPITPEIDDYTDQITTELLKKISI